MNPLELQVLTLLSRVLEETADAGSTSARVPRLLAPANHLVEVRPEEAKLKMTHRFAGPPDQVWRILMEPESRRRYLAVPQVDMIPGAKGTYLGAEFHCRHGKDLERRTVFRITACDVPDFITTYMEFPLVGHVYRTDRLSAIGGGTLNEVFVTWDGGTGPLGAVKDQLAKVMARKFFQDGADRISTMVAEGVGVRGTAPA